MSSCAVINPYVKPKNNNFQETPTLANAVTYAEDTREIYYKAIRDYGGFNRFAGTALIGASSAALGLGIGGGSTSTITTLGLAGASLFGFNAWINGKPRMLTYQAGIDALNCTFVVYQPVRSFKTNDLDKKMVELDMKLIDLKVKLGEAEKTYSESSIPEGEFLKRAGRVLVNGQSAFEKGRQVKVITARAGVGLYDATQNIRAQVTKALIDTEGNVAELVASLSKAIPTNVGLITGRPFVDPPETKVKLRTIDQVILSLEKVTEEVHIRTLEIEKMITGFGSGPTQAQVESCAQIDAVEAGILFRTSPSSNVIINTAKADQSARIVISGGKPTFKASWVSQVPIDLKLGIVNHEFGGGDEAEVLIDVPADAKPGDYKLHVSDSGRGEKTLIVSVVGMIGSEPKLKLVTPAAVTNDPLVSKIQRSLVSFGCLPSVLENGKSSIDGQIGTVTRTAIDKYLEAQVGDESEQKDSVGVESDSDYLNRLNGVLTDDLERMKIEEAANADTSGFGCPATTPT